MDFKSLRARLLFFFSSLLILVQLIALVLMNTSTTQISDEAATQQLRDSRGMVNHYFAAQRETWVNAGKLIAADREVLAALRTKEKPVLNTLLERYRGPLKVDHLAVASDNAAEKQRFQDFIRTRKGLYHQVMVPISDGSASAWLRIARRLDDRTATEIKDITNLNVSFINKHSQGINLEGSSRDDTDTESTENTASASPADLIAQYAMILSEHAEGSASSGDASATRSKAMVMPLGEPNLAIYAVLEKSSDHAGSAISSLRTNLTLLAAFSLLLSLGGGFFIAKTVSHPLRLLAEFAKEIQLGNYAKTVEITRNDEIGELAYTLNVMNQAIALREEEMMHMAYSDTLTNLPNRAMFNERLARAVSTTDRTPTPFTIMMIDLDRFKFINDVLGHESGDFALRVVAKRLLAVLRKSDTVARLGGDEFGIILPTADKRRVVDIARKVLRALEQPVAMKSQHVDLGGSIGIASFPTHGTEASALLRFADVAMYEAKRSGSGFAFFDQDSDAYKQTHLSLLGDIRKAVASNEFELYFQPKVALGQADTPNMEVLIRWNHPTRGFIPPDEFIPFAEHTGAVRLITHWVIDNAIAQAGRWHEQGTEVKISLNVSSRDLLNPNLSAIVQNALNKSKLPIDHLCLEITESALMDDPDKARDMVQSLHDMGIRLSIDDYGTGYSSLAYVANLPVNELKIDKVFVNNMLDSAEDSAIVRSTIELGHYLKMTVVAEGIEERAELARLREYGCDYVQGYLVCKPMQETEMLEWLASKEWRDYGTSNYLLDDENKQDAELGELPKAANS
ncbi:MAG: EAL domain-containing protein [Pseudomonadota bacterium]